MTRYVFKRLLSIIPMLIGITFITYLVIALAPGGPAAGLKGDLNPKISPEYREKQIKRFHFDKPIPVQYGYWISNIIHLDFGQTIKDNQPIMKKIKERLPKTEPLRFLFFWDFHCPRIG
jgi:peptide/nickel transport system permease protein